MRRKFLRLVCVMGLVCVVQDASAEDPLVFPGMCDASAAIALSNIQFVVADDERDTLRIYALDTRSQVGELNLTGFLGNVNGKGEPKEGDIEGAVRQGDTIAWITSHGRNKNAERKVFRLRFFETQIVDGGLATATDWPAYAGLLDDLMAYGKLHTELGFAEAEAKRPKEGGLNIEGLAAGEGEALRIGFRSPLVGPNKRAIVLAIGNASDLLHGGAGPAELSEQYLLNLGGRGIRSMEWVDDRYLIVAGPSTEDDKPEATSLGFRLYSWSGQQHEDAVELPSIHFGELNPEALFEMDGRLVVLSDDGGAASGSGTKCKDDLDANKRFQGMTFDVP